MRRAFTLVEVLVSVGIFLLIAGGIFQAVSVTMSASNDVALARLDSERLDSFQRFVRLVFSNLPKDASVELRVRQGQERGDIVELLVSPAPGLADFSRDATETGGLALSAIPDGAGAFTFSAANFDSEAAPIARDKTLAETRWLALLPGVKHIQWKFAAPDAPGLEETWDASRGRPVLADLVFSMVAGGESHFLFVIPRVQGPKVAGANPQPSPAPSPTP